MLKARALVHKMRRNSPSSAEVGLAARATAARRAAAPGDLIHIPFDQRRAGQGHGQELFQTPPKLEDVTPEAAEFFRVLLSCIHLYYITYRKEGVKTKNRRLKRKC